MARILGKASDVTIQKRNVGLQYPYGGTFDTFLKVNSTTDDQSISNLLYYLAVQRKELYFEAKIGTSILKQVFTVNDNETVDIIKKFLLDDISREIPQLRLRDIKLFRDPDAGTVLITFIIEKSTGAEQAVSFGMNTEGDILYTGAL